MDPADWSESDVLDFIYSLDGTAPETLSGERFRGLSGARLSRLPLDDFVSRDHRHGTLIYRRLHAIIDQRPCLGYIHGRPQEGARGSPDPLDFDINFSHIITVAPRVETQMHFWKGAKFAGSVGHPMTKMFSASWGLRPLTP